MSIILTGDDETGSLWISSLSDILETDFVLDENIKAVCSVVILTSEEQQNLLRKLEDYRPDGRNLSYLYIPVKDIPEEHIEDYFEIVANFIHEHRIRKKNVLIHCHKGRSRSVTYAAYYLMRSEEMTAMEALEYIKEHREIAKPRPEFVQKLKDLDGDFIH